MELGVIGIIIIVITALFSIKGFNDSLFFDRYKFEVDKILIDKQYYRLVTSSLLHSGWPHLALNMYSLYAFSGLLEANIGGGSFLMIYAASFIGGDLLALFIHRQHGDYSAIGASGAVCGIIFASVALYPGMDLRFFFLPFSMPSWIYALLFMAGSIYGIKNKRDNIGHEAHLGGALVGMLLAIALYPWALRDNYLPILVVFVPGVLFLALIISKPYVLLVDKPFGKAQKKHYSIEHKYNEKQVNRQAEIDRILDKISRSGINSLSAKEKQALDEHTQPNR